MAIALAAQKQEPNPLDTIEQLADVNDWLIERPCDDEMMVSVASIWSDLHVTLNWRDDLEGLHLACSFDLKVPMIRRDEVVRLIGLLNSHLMFGHFDMWQQEGTLIYRNGLILAGGAQASAGQLEALIHLALDSCERYFPAFQFVIWGGRSAKDAVQASLWETKGEA